MVETWVAGSIPVINKQFLRATGCGFMADKRRANIKAVAQPIRKEYGCIACSAAYAMQ